MSTPLSSDIISQFLAYDFVNDEQFKTASSTWNRQLEGKSEVQKQEIETQGTVSFFNLKYGTTVKWEEALARLRGVDLPIETESQEEDPQQLSIADLQVILEGGDTSQIPNNKAIPVGLNADAPSASTAPIRKKPWEKESIATQ
ncbi:hypothetical protein QCA50_013115 [Cerrena zonata]|uniref:Peroxisomal membrane protein PEX14-like KPWE domain-containing protein n=1 Tax=Cerrena zonata TaxID=2478898 RepID=A0AAW0G001_9APHY